jgi:ABC-2 type transport system ATP-binding protein
VAIPVVATDVRRAYGDVVALAGVSLDVRQGEMFGIIGPDGAGKTTLLRAICGLERIDAGRLDVFGVDPRRDRRLITSSVGYLSQHFSLYGDLSIDENVAFFAQLHGVRDFRPRRDRLLTLTGLAPFRDRLAARLSGGMKQKLALSCTLVHEPPLVVLDEPTTGVDPVSRREFWKLLAEFVAGGLTIVLATPYLDEAERCSRVALLSEGRVLALDEPARLRRSLPGRTFEVVADDLRTVRDVVSEAYGRERAELFGDRLHVRVEQSVSVDAFRERLSGTTVRAAVREVEPSLEDVFIDLLGRSTTGAAASAEGSRHE